MVDMKTMFQGPIPGENYTSDTKNYPWHRPPEITDYDEAVAYSIKALTDPEYGFNYMSILDAGYTVATAADIFVTQGIANGKWTPDFALLLAGPVARTLDIMAKSYGITAEMGTDRRVDVINPEYLQALSGVGMTEDPQEALSEPLGAAGEDQATPASPGPSRGLMGPSEGPAAQDEQLEMLGYGAAPDEQEVA
jgi:hypothetical protein